MFPFQHQFIAAHGRFSEYYRAHPMTSLSKDRGSVANFGGKIFMPPSALAKLASLHIEYPMLFRLSNQANHGKHTHCGVLEFIAEEGRVYLPQWMMEQLGVETGDIIQLTNTNLSLGKFLKIQPQSVDFLDITDPKAVLENSLRQYSTITQGDIIAISYNNKIYKLLCMEVKPGADGISIIETDLEVDFAPPVGYQEPQRPVASSKASAVNSLAIDEHKVQEKKWNAFSGSGNRLKNKPSSASKDSTVTESASNDQENSGPQILCLPKNKLWFGYKVKESAETSGEQKSADAFSGAGQSLRKR